MSYKPKFRTTIDAAYETVSKNKDLSKSERPNMKEICREALKRYGDDKQAAVCIEELSELQKELCKFLRGMECVEHIAEEIADVEITIEQMKLAFDVRQKVDVVKDHKLKRLQELMSEIDVDIEEDDGLPPWDD